MRDDADRVTAAIETNATDLLAFLARRIAPAHEAADVLSEVFVVVWRRASSLPDDEADARRWMFGIARKILIKHYRQSTRRRALADRLRNILATPDQPGFADLDEYADIHRAIRALSTIDRDIIGLVHWEGFSLADASSILGMKEGTVRSRYHRARSQLRDQLALDAGSIAPVRHSL